MSLSENGDANDKKKHLDSKNLNIESTLDQILLILYMIPYLRQNWKKLM